MKFDHYLITRYNIHLDKWGSDLRGQPTLDDDWMNDRFGLFSTYCFPSVIAQSVKNFHWLIYIETSTSPLHVQKITNLVSAHPHIQLKLVNGYHGCMEDIDKELTKAQGDYVITSRIDNDDALGIEYIRIIQSHFIPRDRALINLLNGYSYNPGSHVGTRLFHMRRNSFCSFIEKHLPMGGHISVRGFPHGTPPPGTSIINVDSRYSWLKVFHERNLLSTPFGYPVFTGHFRNRFGIDKECLRLDIWNTLKYSTWWLMDGVRRKLKN